MMKRKLLKIAGGFLLFAAAAGGLWYLANISAMASAYYAKRACTGVFVSGRSLDEVLREDIRAGMGRGFREFSARVDPEAKLVTASLFGLAERQALYRKGLGCTLLNGVTAQELRDQAADFVPERIGPGSGGLWPEGDRVDLANPPVGIDTTGLDAALENAFEEPVEDTPRRSRAVVVVWRGRIVAERYADGFGPGMPLAGWSMGKSIASAITGILVGDGKLSLDAARLYPRWQDPSDPRSRITLDNLLRMTSGLDFDDPEGSTLSDVRTMLFLRADAAAYAIDRPAATPPGESWIYGSGSSLIVSNLWRRAIGSSIADQFAFPRRALFGPIGMRSAVLEPDASGTFLAAAFAYASARDWARFGLFLLQDGIWQNKRILPEGWVAQALAPTPQSDGVYAAHFWRKVPDFLRPANAPERDLPEDRFYMLGHEGQMVAVVPSRDLVVVRLGLSRDRDAWDPDDLLARILEVLPKAG